MTRSRIAAAVIALTFAVNALATDFEYGAAVGVGTSDNIERVPTNEESETIAMVGFDLRLVREGRKIDADIDLDLSYFDYQNDTFESDVSGMGNADIRARFVPDRFDWVLIDSFGQLSLDPFLASTPANQENVNYFTTGPELRAPLGAHATLLLFARYSLTDYEVSGLDDERQLGGIALIRDLSERSNLSVNATAERVEFDDPAFGTDYDRQWAFLRYEAEGARTRIGAEAGYTEIQGFEDGTRDSPMFEVDISRELSRRSRLTLLGSVRSSDAASSLRAENFAGGGIPSSPGQISSADPFEARHARLGWEFTTPRTAFLVSAGYEDDIYEQQSELDRHRRFILASAWRQITPRISLRAQASVQSFDYESVDQQDDETEFGVFLIWNVAGRLNVEMDVETFRRESTNLLTEFDETRAFIRLVLRDQSGSMEAR